MVGMSTSSNCGVRDHATLLAEALERGAVRCSQIWLTRRHTSLRPAWSEVRTWSESAGARAEAERPDVVLLHYSAFAYSHRGIPVFLHPTLVSLRRAGVPMLAVLHELAYSWKHGGWRGKAWALSQRAALLDLLRACSGLLVTAQERREWVQSRRWLPARRVLVAPVFSNLPPPSGAARLDRTSPTIGLFGYAYQGVAMGLVLDALAQLEQRGVDGRLRLLGAPGPSAAAGLAWREEARARQIADRVTFSGPLPAQELSDALVACHVLLFADPAGPTSRRTTLAGSLASGRPVVAIDGPQSWSELVDAGAIEVVPANAAALADMLQALLADAARREALGGRGREFAKNQMALSVTVDAITELLAELAPPRAPV